MSTVDPMLREVDWEMWDLSREGMKSQSKGGRCKAQVV